MDINILIWMIVDIFIDGAFAFNYPELIEELKTRCKSNNSMMCVLDHMEQKERQNARIEPPPRDSPYYYYNDANYAINQRTKWAITPLQRWEYMDLQLTQPTIKGLSCTFEFCLGEVFAKNTFIYKNAFSILNRDGKTYVFADNRKDRDDCAAVIRRAISEFKKDYVPVQDKDILYARLVTMLFKKFAYDLTQILLCYGLQKKTGTPFVIRTGDHLMRAYAWKIFGIKSV